MQRPVRGRECLVPYGGERRVIDSETGEEIELKPGDEIEYTHMCASKREHDLILGERGFRAAHPPAARLVRPNKESGDLFVARGINNRVKISDLPRGTRFRFTQLAEHPHWQMLWTEHISRRHVWYRHEDDLNTSHFLDLDLGDQRGLHRLVRSDRYGEGRWYHTTIEKVPDNQLPWDVFLRLRLLRL